MIKNLSAKEGDAEKSGSIPGSGRSPGEENGNTLHNPMDRGASWAVVLGVQTGRQN